MAATSAETTSSSMAKPLDHRRLSSATTVASRLSTSSFGSDVADSLWMLPSPTMGDDDMDMDIDDSFEHAKRPSHTLDRDISIALVHALKQENELLRHDLENLQDAQDLARHLRKQVEHLEMELLIRRGDSRASLTGLLPPRKAREPFHTDHMATFESTSSDEYASLDGNNHVEMLRGDGCNYDSDDEIIKRRHDSKDRSPSYESDMEQPEIERECDAYLRDSFFGDKAIESAAAFALDGSEDSATAATDEPAPLSHASTCVDCDALARELAHAHAVIAALLAAESQPQLTASRRSTQRSGDLKRSEGELQDRSEHFDVATQNRESAAQQRIDELEAELAHVRALSSCQKALLDAFQHDLADDGERLQTESGGVFRDDRRPFEMQEQSSRLLRRLQHEHLGGLEVKTLLVALALVCATLYSVSSVLESAFH